MSRPTTSAHQVFHSEARLLLTYFPLLLYIVSSAVAFPHQRCDGCESSPSSFVDASEVLALGFWSGLTILGSAPMFAGAFRREFPSNLHENIIMEYGTHGRHCG